jgi:hypothetical protein
MPLFRLRDGLAPTQKVGLGAFEPDTVYDLEDEELVALARGDEDLEELEPDKPAVTIDVAAASDDELDVFVQDATVRDVVATAGADQQAAQRLLEAERRSRGDNFRTTLVEPLSQVAEQGTD